MWQNIEELIERNDLKTKEFIYTGSDNLEAMTEARNYNKYLTRMLLTEIGSSSSKVKVLDFGAGVGTYADMLKGEGVTVDCLEPDRKQSKTLKDKGYRVYTSIEEVPVASYDFVYSLNVMEHIADDFGVFKSLVLSLKPNGKIFTYVPACQVLYSAMDRLVEHERRYDSKRLWAMAVANNLKIRKLHYVDPVGFAASLVYKMIGGNGVLSRNSVKIYDAVVFPLSLFFQPLVKKYIGKNLLMIAEKNAKQ